MATYTQLQTRAQSQAFSENSTDAALFVNDVYRDVVRRAALNPQSSVETLTGGDWQYSIASDFAISGLMSIEVVTGTSTGSAYSWLLEPVSAETIIAKSTTTTTGQPREYALRGTDTFLVWPAPESGTSLTIYYQAAPTALSSGSDTPSLIPNEYHYVIQYGAAAMLANEEGAELAVTLQQLYEAELAKLIGIKAQMSSSMQKRVRVGYPWRARPVTGRNDVYPAA